MSYRIVQDNPKYFWLIQWFFPHANPRTTMIAFGNTIYSVMPIPMDYIIHETTHLKQQGFSRRKALWWWVKYITSLKFRYSQELQAYSNQAYYLSRTVSSLQYELEVQNLAAELAGPLYGNIVSFNTAFHDLQSGHNL